VVTIVLGIVLSGDDDDDGGGQAVGTGDEDAEIFEDPQGEYTIEVPAHWEQGDDVVSGIELFLVAEPEGGFGPNVNLVAANDAFGVDEQTYIDQADRFLLQQVENGEILVKDVVEGSDGTDRGLIEWTGRAGGNQVHFLTVVDTVGDRSVIATLTSIEADFARLRDEVEPYLLTIRGT
jgi:hypothetical protein